MGRNGSIIAKRVVVGLGVAALTAVTLQTPSVASEARAPYTEPKAGSWKLDLSFTDSTGTLKVKAGKSGKPPKVKSITFVVKDDELPGSECPAAGQTVKVKGSFPLRKAPKWGGEFWPNEHPWISAAKDKKYSTASPNMVGMKPVPGTATVDGQVREVELSIGFKKSGINKPHDLELAMRLFNSDGSGGYCQFSADGKPGK